MIDDEIIEFRPDGIIITKRVTLDEFKRLYPAAMWRVDERDLLESRLKGARMSSYEYGWIDPRKNPIEKWVNFLPDEWRNRAIVEAIRTVNFNER